MQRADAIRNLRTLEPDVMHLLLKNSISPLPLHKVLVLLDTLKTYADQRFERHQRLALAKALPNAIGNLHFGPEVLYLLSAGSYQTEMQLATFISVRRLASDRRSPTLR